MKVTSVKRALGLATAAVGTSGAMMLAPTMANAATAHPAHAQTVSTVSNVSKASGRDFGFRELGNIQRDYRHPGRYHHRGYRGGYGGYGGHRHHRHGYYGHPYRY